MNDSHSLVIHLLDKEYRVACPPGEQDNLLRAARYLDNQMREVKQANVIGLERIAIMAALNMSHELLEAREQASGGDSDGRVQALLDRLDSELQTFEQAHEPGRPVKS
ncbi:cell division protein ZapA [Alloalcanivorax mobilis]|uniref:cell division protein ZapA n=1 Tax=Alloalcanivorax mobilis TaxID=2019569 RepID=UPI000B5B48FC|nr:cell division protein ZapA [Alloalcanivorax mobilis]ASK36037.1 cell division protein ZapA [Alcanivorax sp. N3-2A]|tara:strand:+ start:16547 stop:16870 length:324 start_codon:yes stop_codon:yes gene_type:complete